MLWRTHVMAGIGTLWLLEALPTGVTHDNLPLLIGVAALGALLPDLDAAQSKIKSLSVGGIAPFAPFAAAAHHLWGHRGFLHSLAGLSVMGLLCLPLAAWLSWQPALALLLGYASHLALDACTRSGIPLWPGKKARLHLLPAPLRFVTGSLAEEALFPLLALLVMLWLLRLLPFVASSPY